MQVAMTKPEEQEIVKVCAHCQREHGIKPSANESHGICRWHAVQMFVECGMQIPARLAAVTKSDAQLFL